MNRQLINKNAGNTLLYVLIGAVMLAAIGATSWRIIAHHKSTGASKASNSNISSAGRSSKTTSSSTSANAANLSSGTDNASLNADLNSVSSSLDQENQSSLSSSTALNDQQNEVQVPTN